tara:strand:- start:21 stop:503 length:483 start_codon:yes stop_codon:yes gene_type:complete
MKITNQQELDKLIATADKTNTIVLNENLEIIFDCEIPCNIKVCGNTTARNIEAYGNIKAHNIKLYGNIDAGNITAGNIDAGNITAGNINAWKIIARNIKAHNIKYYVLCIAYESFKCESVSGRRKNSFHKCLDQDIEIIKDGKVTIELNQEQLDKIKHLI